MISEKMIRKYAYMMAKVGLNVQKGQIVLVEAAIEGYKFVPIFVEECYKLGASNVIVDYLDFAKMKVDAAYRNLDDVTAITEDERNHYQQYLDQGACYVRLEGVNPKLMEDCPENQSNAIFNHVDGVRNIMRTASREKHCQWLIAMIPTQEWADYIIPDGQGDKLEKLWETILKLCYITEDNDIEKAWAEHKATTKARGDKIDELHLRKLHYTASNGTDLTVELTPYSTFGMGKRKMPANFIPFNGNIPTEEICTCPEKFGTNGVVYSTKPLVLGGKKVENFGFRFENGKVVDVLANEGKEMLWNLVNTDANSGYLGEAALVAYHSPISMSGLVYFTTLIDENASCHLALGRGVGGPLPEGTPYTFNDSTIHIDFMIGTADMSIVGIDENGKEIQIFKDGDFAF